MKASPLAASYYNPPGGQPPLVAFNCATGYFEGPNWPPDARAELGDKPLWAAPYEICSVGPGVLSPIPMQKISPLAGFVIRAVEAQPYSSQADGWLPQAYHAARRRLQGVQPADLLEVTLYPERSGMDGCSNRDPVSALMLFRLQRLLTPSGTVTFVPPVGQKGLGGPDQPQLLQGQGSQLDGYVRVNRAQIETALRMLLAAHAGLGKMLKNSEQVTVLP